MLKLFFLHNDRDINYRSFISTVETNTLSKPIKVHLFGREENGWALDTDYILTQKSLAELPELVQLTSLEEAEVVHSVWEEPLFDLDPRLLENKRIVCNVCNDFMRLHENPSMIKSPDTIGLWVAMNRSVEACLQMLGYQHTHIPYSVDTEIFQPHVSGNTSKAEIRAHYRVPDDVFLISNFMRDSFGHDLGVPKDQKGAELLLEVGVSLRDRGIPVHFLLAGPRRHWIRQNLQKCSIPYTFIGKETERDDQDINIINVKEMSDLYRASDIHLISSRWEGGPRSVLEAAATKTSVLSTRVGIAPDILEEQSLYESVGEVLDKLEQHYRSRALDDSLEKHYQTVVTEHTVEANVPRFQRLYRGIDRVQPFVLTPRYQASSGSVSASVDSISGRLKSFLHKVRRKSNLRVSLWHEFHKPPYGGGNQFMLALKGAMERKGVSVVNNELSRAVDIHICNSCWFDYKKFQNKAHSFPIRMIHRIDGPVTLYRGEGRSEDELIFDINRQFAAATVFQSAYSFRKSYELGFRSVSPVIIHNGVNGSIFNTINRQPYRGDRKIRLVSSAWSDNPRKGGPFLKWLDQHLDWGRYEYIFVGRVNERFHNIKHIGAVPSEYLAALLRQHDVYVSISQHEPCSNALLEALSCGLPALYRDDGGNPELVSFGGLPFSDENDVLPQLDRLVEHYSSFQRLIRLRTIDDIAERYLKLAERICAWHA